MNMPFDRRLSSRRTFLQSVGLGSAAIGFPIRQANAQDTPDASQNSLPPVPGKQLPPERILTWITAPCPITNYDTAPVFYYQPTADPRWYEVHLYNCQITGMGATWTVPVVRIVNAAGTNTVTATNFYEFQSWMCGVQKVASGIPDAQNLAWYRLVRFTANGKEYVHRLFVAPSNTTFPNTTIFNSTSTDNLIRDVNYQNPQGTYLVQRSLGQYSYQDTRGSHIYQLQQPFQPLNPSEFRELP